MLEITSWGLTFGIVAIGLLGLWCRVYRPVAAASGEGAEFTSALDSPEPVGAQRLRLATYNICGGRGLDRRVDLERIARDLEAVNADVIGLQEVHNRLGRRQAAWLARRLNMALVDGPVRCRGFTRHRSNALLTRLPVKRWRRFPLGNPKPCCSRRGRQLLRQILAVEIDTDTGVPPMTVIVTHIAIGKTDRYQDGRPTQLTQALEELDRHSPAMLLGDLNTRADDPTLKRFLTEGGGVDGLGTVDPERIDWILLRGASSVNAGRENSGASDHPLYWCDIECERAND